MATKDLKRAARIILVGAPGVGKGTQAERLMQRFPQVSAVSSGDLLRNAVRNKSRLGNFARSDGRNIEARNESANIQAQESKPNHIWPLAPSYQMT